MDRGVHNGNCFKHAQFALGRHRLPTKKEIKSVSRYTRDNNEVRLKDIAAAMEASKTSRVVLVRRPFMQSFYDVVRQPIGMFVIQGIIFDKTTQTFDGHFSSYDAGRAVFHDRLDELVLLEAKDITKEGALQLFMHRHAVEGRANLGWEDVTTVWQVMLRDVPHYVPPNNTWHTDIKPLWVDVVRTWKQRRSRGKVFVVKITK